MNFNRQPAVWIALTAALVQLGVSFGLDLTLEQQAAIGAALTALTGVFIKGFVTPVAAPRPGKGQVLPPDLATRAAKLGGYLPGPVGDLFDLLGEDGLRLMLDGLEKARKVAPNQDQTDAAARDL